MFVHYKSQAIIFKKEDRGEADQLFAVYTKDFGKLEIFGKAIRKISSKLRSGAEVFYLLEIEFIQAKIRKTLTDAVLIEKFRNLRKDLKKFKIACQISEITDNLISGQEPDIKIWDLLIEVFKKLNNLQFPTDNLPLIYHYFLWSFLFILGYRLELYNCSVCRKKIAPVKIYFNVKAGGLICQNCSKRYQNSKEIKPETVKILRIIFKKNWKFLPKIKIKQDHLKSLESISKNYLTFVSTMAR